MKRSPWLWPAVITCSALAAGLMALLRIQSPIRALVTLWFLCTGPGLAFLPLLRLGGGWAELTLAVALSLALQAVLAEAMLYAHLWAPGWGLGVLIGLSLAGAALQVYTTGYRTAKELGKA